MKRFNNLSINAKVILFFSFVAIIVLINYLVITTSTRQLEAKKAAVTLSLQNQVLLEKTSAQAFALVQGEDYLKKDLQQSIQTFNANFKILKQGKKNKVKAIPETFTKHYDITKALWKEYKLHLTKIIELPIKIDSSFSYFVPNSNATSTTNYTADDIITDDKLEEFDPLSDLNYQTDLIGDNISSPKEEEFTDFSMSIAQTYTPTAYTEKKFSAQRINPKVRSSLKFIIENKEKLSGYIAVLINQLETNYNNAQQRANTIILLLTFLSVFVLAVCYMLIKRSIFKPLTEISDVALAVSHGDLSKKIKQNHKNEVGNLSQNINDLVENLIKNSEFATNIGNGNFDSSFNITSENDKLGYALIEMRDNLRKVAEEDKKRNWANEGMAQFGDILRSSYDKMQDLAYAVISNLVDYLDANQGGLFTVEQYEEDGGKILELQACYAFQRKKFMNKTLEIGEGLVGQAVQEQETIFLTEVPESYIHITSGLGDAPPRSVLIVPLKINEEIYGAIELASFHPFEKHHIDFVEKISESIASTLSSSKTNEQTKRLLEQSTQMTEEMRSQEEEMRQNMEELQATQEEMNRTQENLRKRNELFDASYYVVETDKNHMISKINKVFLSELGYEERDLIDKPISSVFADDEVLMTCEQQLGKGTIWKGEALLKGKNKPFWTQASAIAFFGQNGEIQNSLFIFANIDSIKEKEELLKDATMAIEEYETQEKELLEKIETLDKQLKDKK